MKKNKLSIEAYTAHQYAEKFDVARENPNLLFHYGSLAEVVVTLPGKKSVGERLTFEGGKQVKKFVNCQPRPRALTPRRYLSLEDSRALVLGRRLMALKAKSRYQFSKVEAIISKNA